MQECLKDAMRASLDAQRSRAESRAIIERSRRQCRLSRLQLLESGRLLNVDRWSTVTVTPGSGPFAERMIFILLMKHGKLFIESCPAGEHYRVARDLDVGLVGRYRSHEEAATAMTEFSRKQRSSLDHSSSNSIGL